MRSEASEGEGTDVQDANWPLVRLGWGVLGHLPRTGAPSQAWLTDVFPLTGGPPPGGGAPWHLRNVLSDSVESSDDEFFDARGE